MEILLGFIAICFIIVFVNLHYKDKQSKRIQDAEDTQRYFNNDRKIGW